MKVLRPESIKIKEEHKMTQEQYYAILREKWAEVDQNSLAEIKAYNEFKRMLRLMMKED